MIVSCARPFSAVGIAWQARRGQFALTVICQLGYRLRPGAASVSDAASVIGGDDLAPFKRGAEVLVVGRAARRHAARRLAVAGIDKVVEGEGTFGPVRAVAGSDGWVLATDPWEPARLAELPPLEQLDFNLAPPDQQLTSLPEEIEITLEGLLEISPLLTTRLPRVAPRVFLEKDGRPWRELLPRCDTLRIDADQGTATRLWRAGTWLESWMQPPRFVVTSPEQPRKPLEPIAALATTARMHEPPRKPLEAVAELGTTAPVDESRRKRPPLPFKPGEGAPPPPLSPEEPRQRGNTLTMPRFTLEPKLPLDSELPSEPPVDAPWQRGSWQPAPPAFVTPPPSTPVPSPPPVPVEPPPPSVAPAPESDRLPLAEYPAERCAIVAAQLARERKAKSEVLARHELDAATWQRLAQHWADAIREQTRRGKKQLMSSYDQAFVAELERERGAVTVEEYAALVVATERGVEAEVLRELDLPHEALPRLQRLWLAKTIEDPALGKAARAAIDEARA